MTWNVTDDGMHINGTKGLAVECDNGAAPGCFVIEHACPNPAFSSAGIMLATRMATLLNEIDQHRVAHALVFDDYGHPRGAPP